MEETNTMRNRDGRNYGDRLLYLSSGGSQAGCHKKRKSAFSDSHASKKETRKRERSNAGCSLAVEVTQRQGTHKMLCSLKYYLR